MNITINPIKSSMDLPDCMTAEQIRSATIDDKYLSILSEYVLCGWILMRAEVQKDLQPHWLFRDETVIIW